MSSIKTFLILMLTMAALNAKPYKGAELRTKEAFTYGRFEVRLKSSPVEGVVSSFFTYHEPIGDWIDNWNEIDIEILGRFNDQVQFNTITPGRVNHVFSAQSNFNPHSGFHTYAFEWTPEYVAWFIDGVEIHRQTGDHIRQLTRQQKLMMNIWPPIHTDWVGVLRSYNLPTFAFYDWVKVYEYTPSQKEPFTLKWRDNFDSWNTDRWQKASHTFDGNNADFIHENVVFKDGYMILCLTPSNSTGYSDAEIIDENDQDPYVQWGRAYGNQVILHFSRPVSAHTAQNPENYIVLGSEIVSIQLDDDERSVEISCNTLDPQKTYLVVVRNIESKEDASKRISLQQLNVPPPLSFPFSVNAGGEAFSEFAPDQPWDESKMYGTVGGMSRSDISMTDQDKVYQSYNAGLQEMHFRVPNGSYTLVFYFAETETDQPNNRLFSIYANGEEVVKNLDLVASGGFQNPYIVQSPPIDVRNRELYLYFESIKNSPILNGIRVEHKRSTRVENTLQKALFTQMSVYPNPFKNHTNIRFALAKASNVTLTIHNLRGQAVKEFDLGLIPSGPFVFRWLPGKLSSGVYFCKLLANEQILTAKMLYL